MDWLYVWSPRYRFFHEFLQASVRDLSGFQIQPVFAEQNLFTPIDLSGAHFLTGIPIKIHVICNYIEKNMGKYLFFTDVDLIVFPEFQANDLEIYKQYDITTMKEVTPITVYNIGCMLIHCSEKTLAFFTRVLNRIKNEKLLDQVVFNEEVYSGDVSVGMFHENEFLQSNMLTENSESYKIVQCLTSSTNLTDVLLEKVATIQSAYDISLLIQFLPEDVQQQLHA